MTRVADAVELRELLLEARRYADALRARSMNDTADLIERLVRALERAVGG